MELYHREVGQGAPLLLIHGTGGSADVFDRVSEPLARHRRVIGYDRRGFTRSKLPLAPKRDYFRRHADDAAELLAKLGAVPAAVMGWSGGGIVALALALHHPEAVSALVVYEPPLHVKTHMKIGQALPFMKTLLWGALGFKRAAAESFLRMALQQTAGGNGVDRLKPEMREQLFANADAILAELAGGTGEELTMEKIAAIRCPFRLIVGGVTAPFLDAAANRLIAGVATLKTFRVPNVGHMMLIDQPEIFVETLEKALA